MRRRFLTKRRRMCPQRTGVLGLQDYYSCNQKQKNNQNAAGHPFPRVVLKGPVDGSTHPNNTPHRNMPYFGQRRVYHYKQWG